MSLAMADAIDLLLGEAENGEIARQQLRESRMALDELAREEDGRGCTVEQIDWNTRRIAEGARTVVINRSHDDRLLDRVWRWVLSDLVDQEIGPDDKATLAWILGEGLPPYPVAGEV